MAKKKIIILGGIGYIGTTLSKLYNNSSHEVAVIDNRFIPEQVKKLKAKGMSFHERDIFNCGDIIHDADIIYHLAGITDVAYTNTEADPEKDALIKKIGTEGSRYVIQHMKKEGKIIFPSSHVIFEGLKNVTLNIKEDFEPKPVLAYSTSKRQTELDLINSDKNYIIMRLASLYGYGENMRLKIVGNLFSKMASQNQKLKLFGGGINYKPLVGVTDVARFMKLVAHGKYNREIYHIVNENLTVAQIAEICREANPQVVLEKTSDEIPNLGYTLSNEKMLSTGFKFNQNIKDEVKKMVKHWKNE